MSDRAPKASLVEKALRDWVENLKYENRRLRLELENARHDRCSVYAIRPESRYR